MKRIPQIFILGFLCISSIAAQQKKIPRFEDYKVLVFKGKIRSPKWIEKVSENEWRDKLGKLVVPPDVNFAGKYFVAVHSCGTGCRYYTMTDVTNGRELNLLDKFATAEPSPKTADGHEYLSILYSNFDSKMLLVQYIVRLSADNEQCRERAFLFEKNKLKSISAIRYKCRKF